MDKKIDMMSPQSGRTYRDDDKVVNIAHGYDPVDEMFKVKSMQKKWRDSFVDFTLSKWIVKKSDGGGGNAYTNAGMLNISSGNVPNSSIILTSKESFTIPVKLSIALSLSQRVVDQTFTVELVSCGNQTSPYYDPETDVDELNRVALLFDGTTATQAKYQVQNSGYMPLTSSAVTVTTTSSNGLYELEPFADETWIHSKVLDSTSGRTNSYVRHQQIPDPNALYKIRLRWDISSTTPPVSTSTTASVQFIACNDYAELTAEITSGRGQSVAGQGIFTTSQVVGNVVINGNRDHDASVSATYPPVRVAGRAITSNWTAVASNDVVDHACTVHGAQITKPYSIPESDWQFACTAPIANTTDVVLKTAGASGIRNYVTGIWVKNTSATATEFVIKDGSTVIFRGHLNASMAQGEFIQFTTPLKGTAATAINFACITTGSGVYVSAQGYQAA